MADYLFGSANIRTLEHAIIGRDRIERLLNAKTTDEAYALLEEYGVSIVRGEDGGAVAREETLLGILKKAYARVTALAPDSPALRLWLYPYDCNNLKAAIKAFVRGIDPSPMLFDFGTVPAKQIVRMVAEKDFQALSPRMQAAAEEAIDAYAKTKNPQAIDLIIDRACYAEMSDAANASDNAFVRRLVQTKIDLLNVTIAVRVLRMSGPESGKPLFEDAFLPGGTLSKEALSAAFAGGEAVLWARLRRSQYSAFAEEVAKSDGSLRALEKIADNAWMSLVKEVRFVPDGLEVIVAFVAAHEYEVKNLRILLSGKEAGIDTQTIRERIRESYV
jgi:V/A-type H+-transporting ATPase subunit C